MKRQIECSKPPLTGPQRRPIPYEQALIAYEPAFIAYEPAFITYEHAFIAYEHPLTAYEHPLTAYEHAFIAYEPALIVYEHPLTAYEPALIAYEHVRTAYEPALIAYQPRKALTNARKGRAMHGPSGTITPAGPLRPYSSGIWPNHLVLPLLFSPKYTMLFLPPIGSWGVVLLRKYCSLPKDRKSVV